MKIMKKKLPTVLGVILGMQAWTSASATEVAMIKASVLEDLPKTVSVSHDPVVFNRRLRDPQFACNIAKLFATGQGVSRDYAIAFRLYQYAAQQGVAEAQYQLGLIYADERGPVNVADGQETALYWLRKAMEQGHKGAKYTFNFLSNNEWYEGC